MPFVLRKREVLCLAAPLWIGAFKEGRPSAPDYGEELTKRQKRFLKAFSRRVGLSLLRGCPSPAPSPRASGDINLRGNNGNLSEGKNYAKKVKKTRVSAGLIAFDGIESVGALKVSILLFSAAT
jgi:hypothetical protein